MTVSVADTHDHIQELVSVVRMAALLGDCTTEGQCSVVHFLWAKGLNAKDIHKEMFPVYAGKCSPRIAVHKLVANLSLIAEVEMDVWKWLRQQSKGFCAASFDTSLLKAMGQVYQCWWRICQEIYVFPWLNIT
jgi:hypothetical protein